MPLRLAALLLLAVSACSPDAPPGPSERLVPRATPPLPTRAPRDAVRLPPALPPTDDRPPVVFDTVEAPRPVPTPAPPPPPEPLAPPTLPPAAPPARPGVAGSCDVRPDESYCFAYTGTGWTPASAAAHCAVAPDATFRPAPCPTAGRIATCTFRRPSDPSREIVYTTYAPADLDLARLACPGVFEVISGR